MALDAKNKTDVVYGSISRPDTNDPLFPAWKRCNNMVTTWIKNSVSRYIVDSLMSFSSTFALWTNLRDRFKQNDRPQNFQIKRQLLALNQGFLNVSTYYTRMKILCDELKDYRAFSDSSYATSKSWVEFQTEDCIMQFLMGLNDSFAQVRAQILMTDPLLTMSKAFSMVVQEESLFLIAYHSEYLFKCSSCYWRISQFHSCWPYCCSSSLDARPRKDNLHCVYCKRKGNTKDQC